MKAVLRLAALSAWSRRLTLGLTLVAIALAVTLLLSVERIRSDARQSFTQSVAGVDLVVGARTGGVQLMLYAVFHAGTASNNIAWDSYQAIATHPAVDWALPLSLFEHGVAGTLDRAQAEWDRRVALGVVMAAAGYPENPRKGDPITGLPRAADDAHVFHAGTTLQGDAVVTAGGRVLCVTALGDTVRVAQRRAYEVADQIRFDGCQMRRDIGHRAIEARRSPL